MLAEEEHILHSNGTIPVPRGGEVQEDEGGQRPRERVLMKTHTVGGFIPPGLRQMLPYLCSDYIVKNQVLEAAEKQSVRHRCLPGLTPPL